MNRRATVLFVLALGLAMSFSVLLRNSSAWTALISAAYPGVRWVEPATLDRWMKEPSSVDLVLLDVRSPEEQATSQLPNARRVDAARPNVPSLAIPSDATVVVYCSIGLRSAAIVEKLEAAGATNVFNLEGGIFDWANQDRPMVRGSEKVDEVHPYNRFFGLFVRKDRRAAY